MDAKAKVLRDLARLGREMRRDWNAHINAGQRTRQRRELLNPGNQDLPHADRDMMRRALKRRTPIDWFEIAGGDERVLILGERHTNVAGVRELTRAIPAFKARGVEHLAFESSENSSSVSDGFDGDRFLAKHAHRRLGHAAAYRELFSAASAAGITLHGLLAPTTYAQNLMFDDVEGLQLQKYDAEMSFRLRSMAHSTNGRIAIWVGAAHATHGGIPTFLGRFGLSHSVIHLVGGESLLAPTWPDLETQVDSLSQELERAFDHLAHELGADQDFFQVQFPKRTRTGVRWAVHVPQRQIPSTRILASLRQEILGKYLQAKNSRMPPEEISHLAKRLIKLDDLYLHALHDEALELTFPTCPEEAEWLRTHVCNGDAMIRILEIEKRFLDFLRDSHQNAAADAVQESFTKMKERSHTVFFLFLTRLALLNDADLRAGNFPSAAFLRTLEDSLKIFDERFELKLGLHESSVKQASI